MAFYSRQGSYSSLPTSVTSPVGNASIPITASSVALSGNVWAAVSAGSNSRVILIAIVAQSAIFILFAALFRQWRLLGCRDISVSYRIHWFILRVVRDWFLWTGVASVSFSVPLVMAGYQARVVAWPQS
ncbi:hypothetical protein AZE42_04486 [Rhizopogon vesiculosus]|uniref:Uncharacterized protein n=1 Tax=Rhizopogon vesiculosus TaxID=180088 RepID=A0A1J8PVY7_9AGAM|nr:hypothetical protein AZE42_04486 [Rhizopogon vesiculosus]